MYTCAKVGFISITLTVTAEGEIGEIADKNGHWTALGGNSSPGQSLNAIENIAKREATRSTQLK